MLLATPAPRIEGMPLRRPGMAWNRAYQRIFDRRTSRSFAAVIEPAHTISRAAFRRRRGGLRRFQQDSGYDSELLEETARPLVTNELPPARPQHIPPVTGLGPKDKDTGQSR
jgi:hypothetical protein